MRFEDKVAIVTGNLYEAAHTHPTLAPLAPAVRNPSQVGH